MLVSKNDHTRSATFVAISILLHALLVFLIPGIGVVTDPQSMFMGATTPITIVQVSPVKPTIKAINTVSKSPATVPKPTTTSSNPISKPAQAKPAPKTVAPAARVLTSTNNPEDGKKSVPDQSQTPAQITTKPDVKPVATTQASAEPEPLPGPPTSGELVQRLGIVSRYPSKEAASLVQPIMVKAIVRVPPSGTVHVQLVNVSHNDELDNWINRWISERLDYKRLESTYEVAIDALVDPITPQAKFNLPKPDERVRIVQP